MKKETFSSIDLLRRVISFAKPFKKSLIIVFSTIFLTTTIDALNNFCFSRIFNIVQKHGTDKTYFPDAMALLGLALMFMFFRILIVSWRDRVKIKNLTLAVMNNIYHLSMKKFFSFSNGQHVNEHSGVKQNIVSSGANSIKSQMDLMFYRLFPTVTQFLVSIAVLIYCGIYIGGIFLVIGIFFCSMMYRMNKRLVPGVRKIRNRGQINSRLISELYRFVTTVKIEGQEEKSLDDLSIAQQKHQDISVETWFPTVKYLTKIRIVTVLIRFSALLLVIYLVFQKQFTTGTMFLVFTYSTVFLNSLWDFMDLHQQFLIDRINIEKYFELLEVTPDIVMAENPIRLKTIEGRIEFKNVSFWYPKRVKTYEESEEEETGFQDDPVLKSVSFVVNPGEKIGIIGESGSGKSTLAGLLRRSFDPQEGQILVDGHDLRLLEHNLFLGNIGNVEQEVVVFDFSIRDNILFGLTTDRSLITEDRLMELVRIARIDAYFPRLEHGFDTMVGEKGVKLSGGEKQRLGIARALAKNPSLLIFDEATSALDAVSEKIVQTSIDDACKGKTAIVIAHRLSTVKNCDKILVFRHGILLAQGSHAELLESCEYYSELVHHQMMVA